PVRKQVNLVGLHDESIQYIAFITQVFGEVHVNAADAHEHQVASNVRMGVFLQVCRLARKGINDQDVSKIQHFRSFGNDKAFNQFVFILNNVKNGRDCIDDLHALRSEIL